MSESTKVWIPLRKASKGWGLVRRLEPALGSGLPDVFYCLAGVCGFIELKYLKKWPVRDTTGTTLGVTAAQRLWLGGLAKAGGRSFVLVRIEEEWLLIPAYAGLDKATREEWCMRALIHTTGGMDWDRLMDILTH